METQISFLLSKCIFTKLSGPSIYSSGQLSLLYFSNKPLFRFDRFNHFGLILQELKRERNTKDAETKRRENCHLTWLS